MARPRRAAAPPTSSSRKAKAKDAAKAGYKKKKPKAKKKGTGGGVPITEADIKSGNTGRARHIEWAMRRGWGGPATYPENVKKHKSAAKRRARAKS